MAVSWAVPRIFCKRIHRSEFFDEIEEEIPVSWREARGESGGAPRAA